jgi:hypothetical protein
VERRPGPDVTSDGCFFLNQPALLRRCAAGQLLPERREALRGKRSLACQRPKNSPCTTDKTLIAHSIERALTIRYRGAVSRRLDNGQSIHEDGFCADNRLR